MKKVNRENIMNTTTPDSRSEKEGLASTELRELSSEELASIIGGVKLDGKVYNDLEKFDFDFDLGSLEVGSNLKNVGFRVAN